MNRLTLSVVASTLVLVLGCGSSNSDGGGAGSAGAGRGGSDTSGSGGAGATSAGGVSGGGGMSAGGGSGAGAAGTSGNLPPLDPTADARALSDGDKGVLCDWVNDTLGGYGLMTTCAPGMTVSNVASQSVCVATFFRFQCKVTVQDVETCIQAQAPSHACNGETASCHQLSCQ